VTYESKAARPRHRGVHAAAMTITLDAPRPVVTTGPRLRRMRYEPAPGTTRQVSVSPEPAPVRTVVAPADTERVRRMLTGTVRLAMEVLDGRRPPVQLGRHFDDATLRYWRVAAHQRRVRAPARVVRMLLCLPRPGAAEVTAVCDIDGRVRALAARFEQPDPAGVWRCTALRLG
jgi:Family of unknown function (DUF6459)